MPQAAGSISMVGIGLRQAHAQALRASLPPLGFLEVHSENFFTDGGPNLRALSDLGTHYPISLHGVGLSLGSASGIDLTHLDKLARLVERINPVRVSDHASFARVAPFGQPAVHASDLLPVALTEASLSILVGNIQQVQDRLQRPILIENLSAYMAYSDDLIPEVDFLVSVCRQSGCQLLLDLNNLIVNGLNRVRRAGWQTSSAPTDNTQSLAMARAQALDFVWQLPVGMVGQIHLAGFRWPEQADRLVIDDHSQRVSATGWDVYEQTIEHLGALPTLIEWDVDIPPLAVLLDEARLAANTIARITDSPESDADQWGGE